jgi:hypothetical protein
MKTLFGHSIFQTGTAQIIAESDAGLLGVTILPIPNSLQEGLETVRVLREREIHFCFAAALRRISLPAPVKERYTLLKITPNELTQIVDSAGKFYLGRNAVGELGGMLYWPEKYLLDPREQQQAGGGEYFRMEYADDLAAAEKLFRDRLTAYLKDEHVLGFGPIYATEAGSRFDLQLESGIDIPILEMMPGDPELMTAAIRGAVRAYKRDHFGILIAHGWYGGNKRDELYYKRFKNALFYAWMSGAKWISSESGQMGFKGYGGDFSADSPETRRFRDVMLEFKQFCDHEEHDAEGPETSVGFVLGNHDGWSGLWQTIVWGQHGNEHFVPSDAEESWKLLQALYHKQPWFDYLHNGDEDISGQVPGGVYDLVPSHAPQEAFERYKILIFLGWNTMNDELYSKLVEYVRQGGHLIMALPHLTEAIRRDATFAPWRNGDWSELFGIKFLRIATKPVKGVKFVRDASLPTWKFPVWGRVCDPFCANGGFARGELELCGAETLAVASGLFDSEVAYEIMPPVFTEFRLGEGSAFLLNSAEFPGSHRVKELAELILSVAMRGETDAKHKVFCPESVRYTFRKKSLYLLNTDPDLNACCRYAGREYVVKPQEMRKLALEKND